METQTDLLHLSGRICFNPEHPFLADFRFLHDAVAGRTLCRQTLPSPANLLLEIYAISEGHHESLYPASTGVLIDDIAGAYRRMALHLHELGCASLQYDDTALGMMCDDNYTKRLLQGGVDLIRLHKELIDVINRSLEGLPGDMEKSIFISGGDTVVPEWEHIEYPDNVMPKALALLDVDKFFIPLDLHNDYAVEVLRHIPDGKDVVLGIIDAHSPFPDNTLSIDAIIRKATHWVNPQHIAISPRTGFKVSSYKRRGLLYEDQWRKLNELISL